MYSRVDEFEVGVNDSTFRVNEQQKVYDISRYGHGLNKLINVAVSGSLKLYLAHH